MEIIIGGLLGGLVAFGVAWWQRGQDRAAARQETVTVALGRLGAAVAELRWEAARLAGVAEGEKYDESRKLAPLRGRMVAAHTEIYAASNDERVIQTSRAVVHVGLDLIDAGAAVPFDPAKYEMLRSVLERTFRNLRQAARESAGLALLEGEPRSETSDDSETEADPVLW